MNSKINSNFLSLIAMLLILNLNVARSDQGVALGGDWLTPSSWIINGVTRTPNCGDTLVIPSGVTVTVTNQTDYSACSQTISISVAGIFEFTNGNKMDLPCSSTVNILPGGILRKATPGGGNSTNIEMCSCITWTAGMGTISGPQSLTCATTLPVSYLLFTAEAIANSVELKWVTATEINNDFYKIERSTDGFVYNEIALVPGAGNSTKSIDYTFNDSDPLNGVSYYRLKQTDYDGKFSYSDVVVVRYEQNRTLKILSCSVNSGMLELYYSKNDKSETLVNVTDSRGKTVYTTKVYSNDTINHIRLDVLMTKAGYYFITLSNSETAVSEKIVFNN